MHVFSAVKVSEHIFITISYSSWEFKVLLKVSLKFKSRDNSVGLDRENALCTQIALMVVHQTFLNLLANCKSNQFRVIFN